MLNFYAFNQRITHQGREDTTKKDNVAIWKRELNFLNIFKSNYIKVRKLFMQIELIKLAGYEN